MTTKRRREKALESRCVAWARDRGVQVGKLSECVGLPDRIFFVPGGRPLVPEFKDPGGQGEPSPAQIWHIKRLREQGYEASLVEDWDAFLALMRKVGVK